MRNYTKDNQLRVSSQFQIVAATLLLCLASQAVFAQTASFRIGENADVVKAAIDLERNDITQEEFDTIMMQATCQNPYARLQDRNRPFLAVINTSNNADDITSVEINMEEAGFEFGTGDMAGDGFDGFLSMLSSASDAGVQLTSSSYGADNSELVLNFAGLSPGQAAIFRVDIDEPGGVFMFPDYREAFQGANAGFGRDGDLALLTANFDSGASSNALFPSVGRLQTAGLVEGYHSQTMTPPAQSMVPEPTSVCLIMAGFSCLGLLRRRS